MTDTRTRIYDPTIHPMGRLVDRRTMRWERVFPVDRSELWDAIVDADKLGSWWNPFTCTLDARVGGHFHFSDDPDTDLQGTVIDFEPGRRIVFSFTNGSGAIFDVSAEDRGRARLVYTHWLPAGFALPQDPEDEFAREWNYQPGGPGLYPPQLAAAYHGSLGALDLLLGAAPPEGFNGEAPCQDEYRALMEGPLPEA